jgi:hypothetical protein
MPWQRQQRFDQRATSVDGPTDHLFSSTVAQPTMRGVWNVRAIRLWARASRASGANAAPFNLTAPR